MSQPPGSLGLPFVGEALKFLANPFSFQLERTRKHGSVWKTRILGSTVVFFSGPKAFSFFMDPENFTRENGSPPHLQELLHRDVVPFLGGEKHRARKRLLLPAFAPEALKSYLPNLEKIFGHYLESWSKAGEVGLATELSRVAFDLANVLFAGADPERHDATRMADFETMARGMFATPVKLPFTTFGKAIAARDRLRVAIKDAVAAGGKSGTALGVLQNARDADDRKLSAAELEIELLHLFAATHAGIAGSLAWMAVALAENPEVKSKVEAEIGALGRAPFSLESMTSLAYTTAVGCEVRRAWPIFPTTFFGVARKNLAFDGLEIEGGWKGVGAIWPTLQDSTSFRDPEKFSPDRFQGGRTVPDNAFVPHGSGSPEGHRCPGDTLTTLVMSLFSAMLLRDYDIELPSQDLSVGPGSTGPLPKGGLRARIRRR